MSTSAALWISLLLLVGNAFFVGAEFAIMSVRRSQLEPLVTRGVPGAKTALFAVEHVSQMLTTAQIGVTVCTTSLGALAEQPLAGAATFGVLPAGTVVTKGDALFPRLEDPAEA